MFSPFFIMMCFGVNDCGTKGIVSTNISEEMSKHDEDTNLPSLF